MKYILLLILPFAFFNVGWTKITIVPSSSLVSIDGKSYKVINLPIIPDRVHAIHIEKPDTYNVETKDGKPFIVDNTIITDVLKCWKQENDKELFSDTDISETQPTSKTIYRNVLYDYTLKLNVVNDLLNQFPDNLELLEDKKLFENIIEINKKMFSKIH